jgi:hypothetical protein
MASRTSWVTGNPKLNAVPCRWQWAARSWDAPAVSARTTTADVHLRLIS